MSDRPESKVANDPFPLISERVHVDGVALHVIHQGRGPAVLFCHGFPDTARTWRRQMQAVAEAGYRAVALDMRGYGESDAPTDPECYSAPYVVGDLAGVLDALDIPSAVLVGHDWGADHAQRAMLMRPDRFHALVSLSIPYAPRGEMSHWDQLRSQGLGERYYAFDMMKAGAEAGFEPAENSIPNILYWLSGSPPSSSGWDPIDPSRHMLRPAPVSTPTWADPEYIAHTISAFERSGFRGGLNYYRAAQATFDLMAAYKDKPIEQPSLYIWGLSDGLCRFLHQTVPTVEALRRTLPGLVDHVPLAGVGHWIQHEAPDRLNAELLKFLRTIGEAKRNDRPDR